jgi:soluble lytic murein transglycosylase-like protein
MWTVVRRRIQVTAAAALMVTVVCLTSCAAGTGAPPLPPPASSTPTDPIGGAFSPFALPTNPDPSRYVPQVRAYAAAAGVDPTLLMAILYNEDYKPHDPRFERAWQQMNPDAAFGIANMHQAAFDDTKQGREFAQRDWHELPDDPALAIEAAAWYLHDLAARLPARNTSHYTTTDLLAIGYNAGPATMIGIAHGAHLSNDIKSYLDALHTNWARATTALVAAGR